MKSNKLAPAIGALLLSGSSVQALADISANIGAVSNYLWRGISQTADGAAIQGGVDYSHDSGFSAGTWLSNVDGGTELDLYLGFDGQVGDFNWGVNTIYYAYPDIDDADFWEIGGSAGYKFATVGLQYTIDGQADSPSRFTEGDIYYYGSLSFDLTDGFGVGATLGHYDFDDFGSDGDYTHWQLSLSKDAGDFGSFSLNYDQTDGDEEDGFDEDAKFWVGWNKEF
jgi:uncharacterized protein (TIGR02001 family)